MQINSWSAGQPWSCLLLHNGHPGCQETCLWLPNPGRWASAGLLDTLIYILKTSIISKYMSIWKLFNSWYLTIPYHALPYLTIPYHTLPYLTHYLLIPCYILGIVFGGAKRQLLPEELHELVTSLRWCAGFVAGWWCQGPWKYMTSSIDYR